MPRMPGSPPSRMIASVSSAGKAGTVAGNSPSRNAPARPAISQWPDGVSLPLEPPAPRHGKPRREGSVPPQPNAQSRRGFRRAAETERDHVGHERAVPCARPSRSRAAFRASLRRCARTCWSRHRHSPRRRPRRRCRRSRERKRKARAIKGFIVACLPPQT